MKTISILRIALCATIDFIDTLFSMTLPRSPAYEQFKGVKMAISCTFLSTSVDCRTYFGIPVASTCRHNFSLYSSNRSPVDIKWCMSAQVSFQSRYLEQWRQSYTNFKLGSWCSSQSSQEHDASIIEHTTIFFRVLSGKYMLSVWLASRQ